MGPAHSPGPERSAVWRRWFADEARAERPDVATLCLLIGAEADESLDEAGMDAAQIELDRLAGELPFRPGGPRSWATALAEHLGGRCGFRGRPGDYQRLESSLLHEVLRRRRGLPILLSVVWMEVARRAGAPVYGVALPGHFVVGFGRDPERQVLADPFDGGRVLTGIDAELLVAGATGAPLDPSMLTPADHCDVALWAVDLSLLLPSHPARLRYDRAQLLVQRGEFLTGATELDAYADIVAAVDEPAADRMRQQARAARAMLN